MKKIVLISAAILLILLLALLTYYMTKSECPNKVYCNDKIKTITSAGSTTTFIYESSSGLGRLIRMESGPTGSSTPTSTISFDYSIPGQVTETFSPSSTPIVYKLDGEGNAISDNRGTGVVGSPYTYTYDYPGGFSNKSIFPNYTDNRQTVNGNLV